MFNKYNLQSFFGKTVLDDVVGRKGEKLSGGQRQTIFLLRILLGGNKKIVILDEPTSSLDEESSSKILALIDDVMKDRTVLIITHDKKLGEVADRIVKLD
jgi:ABC-type transport system involved in cytochrome bd biosynthesis fused ATPase/permease subunit